MSDGNESAAAGWLVVLAVAVLLFLGPGAGVAGVWRLTNVFTARRRYDGWKS